MLDGKSQSQEEEVDLTQNRILKSKLKRPYLRNGRKRL